MKNLFNLKLLFFVSFSVFLITSLISCKKKHNNPIKENLEHIFKDYQFPKSIHKYNYVDKLPKQFYNKFNERPSCIIKVEDVRLSKEETTDLYVVSVDEITHFLFGELVIKLRYFESPSNPSETNPGESNPGETNPGETSPDETSPDETNPGESNPDETNPGESNPGESNPGETTPGESNPGEDNEMRCLVGIVCFEGGGCLRVYLVIPAEEGCIDLVEDTCHLCKGEERDPRDWCGYPTGRDIPNPF